MNYKYKFLRIIKVIVIIALILTVLSAAVMHLWNGLMPSLFGWRMLSFGEAMGLLILCKILFGGIRGPGMWGPPWMHHMRQRWQQMTPEEREKFREMLQSRRGFFSRCGAEPMHKEDR